MRIYRINGSGPLNGTVRINGCKNSVVAILPATILVRGVCRLTNVPDISDIRLELKMLEELGAKVDASGLASDHIIEIDTSDLSPKPITADFVSDAVIRRFPAGTISAAKGADRSITTPICSRPSARRSSRYPTATIRNTSISVSTTTVCSAGRRSTEDSPSARR